MGFFVISFFILMKFTLGIALALMIFAAIIFGSFLMNHAMTGGHSACLTADVTGSGSCIQSNIMPGFVIGISVISFFLLLFAAIGSFLGSSQWNNRKRGFIKPGREEEISSNSAQLNLLAYLAFHENSPSFA